MSYLTALMVERQQHGLLALATAGLPADLLHTAINAAKGQLFSYLVQGAVDLVSRLEPDMERRIRKQHAVIYLARLYANHGICIEAEF